MLDALHGVDHKKNCIKLVGTTVYTALLGEVLVQRRSVVVSKFRKAYSARLQELNLVFYLLIILSIDVFLKIYVQTCCPYPFISL